LCVKDGSGILLIKLKGFPAKSKPNCSEIKPLRFTKDTADSLTAAVKMKSKKDCVPAGTPG